MKSSTYCLPCITRIRINFFLHLILKLFIGDAKHKAKVVYFIEEIRNTLADCLLYWAIQNPFNESNTLKLIRYLSKISLDTPGVREAAKSSGENVEKSRVFANVSTVDCVLLHSLLACFNAGELTPGGWSLGVYVHAWDFYLFESINFKFKNKIKFFILVIIFLL